MLDLFVELRAGQRLRPLGAVHTLDIYGRFRDRLAHAFSPRREAGLLRTQFKLERTWRTLEAAQGSPFVVRRAADGGEP